MLSTTSLATDTTLTDLREIQRETRELDQTAEELRDSVARTSALNAALEHRLAAEERELDAGIIDVSLLTGARLEQDASFSRLAVIEGRIEQHSLELARLRAQIVQIQDALAGADRLDTEVLRREAALELLREKRAQVEVLLAAFAELAAAGRRHTELLTQRLRLLQSRLELGAIDDAAGFVNDERVAILQPLIADFLFRAARLSRDADTVVGDTAVAEERRRVIRHHADEALTRAFLRQNDLELVLAGNRLDSLATLRDDSSMPLHILEAGGRKLGEIDATLDRIDHALAKQLGLLDSKRTALRRQGLEQTGELRAVDDLEALIHFQRTDIETLRQQLTAERTTYARVVGEALAASLLEHRPLPTAAADWRRITRAVQHLPHWLGETVSGVWQELELQAEEIGPRQRALAVLGAPALAMLMLWGSRRLRVPAPGSSTRHTLALVMNASAHALPAAIPAALWGLVGMTLGLGLETLLPILLLLGLWPALGFALQLARDVLLHGQPAAAGDGPSEVALASRRRFYRYLRLGLALAAGIAAFHILARLLPLPPLLTDLLDRLAMLALLGLVLPALGLRGLITNGQGHTDAQRTGNLRFLRWLSRMLPGVVVVIGVVGLLGFTSLAWVLMGYVLWLILVGLVLSFAVGLLGDVVARTNTRLETSSPDGAAFWRTQFVEPGYRIGQLALFLGGGWLLLWLWGWNAETPMVRWVRELIDMELLRIGEAPLTIGHVLVSAILVGAAFWIGGWSQQVGYRLAYRRVRDRGLRQALATFTRYVVIVAGLLLALKIIGFDLTAITVFAASLGVGIGFGLQNIVNNFISGILLLAERPLRVGDYVTIGPHEGNVTQLGMRSLTVLTPDKQEVVIPNGSVISKEFTNWTRSDDTVRQVHYIRIRYDSDWERAMALIGEVLAANPNVLNDPPPGVYLWEYNEEGVRLRVQFCFRFVHGPGGFATRSAVLSEIGRRFQASGIAFAEVRLLPALAVPEGAR